MIHAHCLEDTPPVLITPEEITVIMARAGTSEDMQRAYDIVLAYCSSNDLQPIQRNWDLMCIFSNIYQAGRLQGIREQKARQRKRELNHKTK